jgi:predicted RNase H-like nuclease
MSDFGASGLDDVYDAAAMAWTARRVARGEAVSLPDPPEVFSDGIPSAIWV